MKLQRIFFVPSIILIGSVLILVGCKGDKGPTGPAGTNPQLPPVIQAVYAIPDSVGTRQVSTLVVNAYDPNGDSLNYQWTVTSGTLATPNAPVTEWTAPDTAGVFVANVTVSDNDGSTSGVVHVGVDRYVPSVLPSYLGSNAQNCYPCHSDKINTWQGTPHASAFADTVIPIAARTTGFNPELDNGGYDDNPNPGLENVQCEACHGPLGPNVVNHANLSPGAFSGENCGTCHVQWTEYQYSGHGTARERAGGHEAFIEEWGHAPCQDCHIGEGFLKRFDPDWADRPIPHLANQVTCGTCHDPHAADPNTVRQLRGLTEFSLVYGGEDYPTGYPVNNLGLGQVCGQCHHARRDRTYIMNAINNGSQRANPHPSAQADMITGRGSYEIPGFTYDRSNQHDFSSILTDACVSCHMNQMSAPYPHDNHNFHADPQFCSNCHSNQGNFDIDGKQTEIQGLMDQLAQLLPTATQDESGHWEISEDTRDTTVWSRAAREAAWAWWFIEEDGTHGIHNYPYAHSLLQNAIDYMTPGASKAARYRPRTSYAWVR